MDDKKTRAAFEKWYSGRVEWASALEKTSRGEYKYAGVTGVSWDAWEAATKNAEREMLALLTDIETVIRDLYACDDANCIETNCLHVLPRIRALLAGR